MQSQSTRRLAGCTTRREAGRIFDGIPGIQTGPSNNPCPARRYGIAHYDVFSSDRRETMVFETCEWPPCRGELVVYQSRRSLRPRPALGGVVASATSVRGSGARLRACAAFVDWPGQPDDLT